MTVENTRKIQAVAAAEAELQGARSDEELIAACRAGDAGAWETLVTRYRRLIYSIPLQLGLSTDEAADVFQLTWLRLYQRLATLREPARARSWLASTAHRLSIDIHAARRGANEDSESVLAQVEHPGPLPEDEILLLEEQQRIRAAVDQLPKRCQELLTLLFYDPSQPSYTVVAQRLGIPVGSIGPVRQRCFSRLRALLLQ
jgi:RNA polymerase sigma factor (sigma-70 family)